VKRIPKILIKNFLPARNKRETKAKNATEKQKQKEAK